jgi:HTH-type transcriptional regulator/antitoxin HigA
MKVKILKTQAEYESALRRIEALMDAGPGSPEEEELELLALLVEKYEDEHYPIDLPDPVEAIKFRMDQDGLEPKDMIKYLGSQSKVSEVLNYKRTLSLSMMRALHHGLGIPAEVLLQDPDLEVAEQAMFHWRDYPFAEMFKRGYFDRYNNNLLEARRHSGELLADLFSVFQDVQFERLFCKHGVQEGDGNALKAWQAQALRLALRQELPEFSREQLTEAVIQRVVQLSLYSKGPQMAPELLNSLGIHFVLLPHLPKTYLDGACFYTPQGGPVIAMTLRHDRLDNFWFTLVHELAHLYLHMDAENLAFFDDTERPGEDAQQPREAEANAFARDMLIPPAFWERQGPRLLDTQDEEDVIAAAAELGLGVEIIAGRIRWESGDYSRFSHLIGHRKVRDKFPEFGKSNE